MRTSLHWFVFRLQGKKCLKPDRGNLKLDLEFFVIKQDVKHNSNFLIMAEINSIISNIKLDLLLYQKARWFACGRPRTKFLYFYFITFCESDIMILLIIVYLMYNKESLLNMALTE